MMEKCRLCLSEGGMLTHVSQEREGLPLSVIAMIICPIKIERNDNLPKYICADCVEILVTTYHLRDTSNQNEKYLRELPYTEPLVKQEYLDNVNPIFFEPSIYAEDTRSDDGTFEEPLPSQNLSEPSAKGYTVDCFKNDNKSFVWKYFGALCDSKGNVIDKNFFYCVFCVQEDKLTKYSKHNATTCYSRHLNRLHTISEPPKRTFATKKLTPGEFYTCDICGDSLSTKPSLKRHMQRKHEKSRVADGFILPARSSYSESDYMVDCFKSRKTSTTSMVWNFFGRLLDLDGIEVLDGQGYHFCKLCNDMNVLTKFSVNNATTGLMHHLVTKHGVSSETKVDEVSMPMKQEPNAEFDRYSVNCYKAAVNKSFCWNYFGMLLDAKHAPVETESEFIYCKICVMKGKTEKKFRKTCATTNLLFHLKASHGVVSDKSGNEESLIVKKSMKRDEEQEKTCSICSESFETRKAYFNHLRSVHNTIERSDYVCHVCSKSFTKNYILAKHMKIHSGIDYFCSLCPASFTYPEGLKRHEKIHDPSHLSKYQCDQCPNSYAERKSLKQHILTVHLNKTRARNHRCELCDMTFVTSNNLKRHVMKHTGEKPHECQYCETSYTQKGDLIKHLQRAHNTMYNCAHSGCSASFRLLVELREHYSVHFKSHEKTEVFEDPHEDQ